MNNSTIVREQFNKQADRFDRWSVTRDEQHADFLLEMACVSADDAFLDVACGTGALALRAAKRAHSVVGVDVSERMLEFAAEQAARHGFGHMSFRRSDVCSLPFEDAEFSVAGSKSAFHHMPHFQDVFAEMVRCTRAGGVICLQDIMAYEDPYIDAFAEELELAIDASHARTLSRAEFVGLFKRNGLKVTRAFESVSRLDMDGYIGHAVQNPENAERVAALLERAKGDARIAQWIDFECEKTVWKRRVMTIAGRKEA